VNAERRSSLESCSRLPHLAEVGNHGTDLGDQMFSRSLSRRRSEIVAALSASGLSFAMALSGCGRNPAPIGGNAGIAKPDSYSVIVDDALVPAPVLIDPDEAGQMRPIACVTDGSGIPTEFVENELFVPGGDLAALDGRVNPDRVITVVGSLRTSGVVVDQFCIGYTTDAAANAVLVIDDIETAEGTVTPGRTLQGPVTGLSEPRHMTLRDRE